MDQIVISQNENQIIKLNSNIPNLITVNNTLPQNINISIDEKQKLKIEENKNQTILIGKGGIYVNITDVLVNGVSVVTDNIAYIIVPTKLSELENDEGFITKEIDPTVPNYVKAISISDINNWNNKQNILVSGSNIKTINNNSILGSGNLNISTTYTAGDGININENVISNTITSYDDLSNLPTIPTQVSDLTNDLGYVESSELSEVAFNGDYNALSNIPDIPTDTSDLINDSGFIDKDVNDLTYYTLTSNLSTVATSGDYDDLINKPTIPTVNDGTLTIQQNGTNVTTFTANQSTNTTANITVPTQTSDLTNNSGYIDKNVNDLTNYMTTTDINNNLNNKANEYFTNGFIFNSGNDYLYLGAVFQPPNVNATLFLTNKIPNNKKLTITGSIRLFASNSAPISTWTDIATLSPTLYYIPDTNIVRINLVTSLSGNWQSATLNISNGTKIKMENLT